jgi:hypothetical protein
MLLHWRLVVMVLIAGLAICSPSSAQSPVGSPPAGSFGAGTAAVNGIPIGPGSGTGLNNSVNDPSGFGNAAKMPPLPRQATIPTVPEAVPMAGSRGSLRSRPVVTRISPPTLASLRGSRARTVIRNRDRLLGKNLTSICRGC